MKDSDNGFDHIPVERDAFGAELKAYFERGERMEIIERDDGFISCCPAAHIYFARYPDWLDSEREAILYARGRVLDIGCGAGRVALYLQERGFDVTAIDNSPGAVEISKRQGVAKVRNIPFRLIGSDRSLGIIDTFVMFGGNFGLFENYENARRMLEKMREMSSDKGLIIASAKDPYTTDIPEHIRYQQRNRERGKMPGEFRLRIRHRGIIGPWFDYLFASKEELGAILRGTGWSVRRYIDSEQSESQYVAIIEKS